MVLLWPPHGTSLFAPSWENPAHWLPLGAGLPTSKHPDGILGKLPLISASPFIHASSRPVKNARKKSQSDVFENVANPS